MPVPTVPELRMTGRKHARGTTNGNVRGNNRQRKARKEWLLQEFGDGTTVACHMRESPGCLGTLTAATLWVDRYPIPGAEGGTYRRDNIRPGCQPCQTHAGGRLGAARKAAKKEATHGA